MSSRTPRQFFTLIFLLILFSVFHLILFAQTPKPGDQNLPQGAFRNFVGLNEGLRWSEHILDECARIGIKILRRDLNWNEVEKSKGQFDWRDMDKYLSGCEKRGIKAILIIGKTNPVYDSTATVAIPGNYLWKPYENFVKAAVTRYRNKDVIWEVWNEPDIPHMHGAMAAVQYIEHAIGVMKVIRSISPQATIAGPANGYCIRDHGNNWSMQVISNLERRKLREDFWRNLNIWTGHQYTSLPPDKVMIDGEEMYDLQRRLLDQHGAKDIPYSTGERGFTANPKSSQAYAFAGNEQERINRYIRQNLWGIYKEPRAFIINYVTYDVYESGKQIIDNPAGESLKVMLDVLGDYTFASRIKFYDDDVVLLKFSKDGINRYAVWDRAGRNLSLNIPVYAEKTFLYDLNGKKTEIKQDTYLENIPVSGSPVFLQPEGEYEPKRK